MNVKMENWGFLDRKTISSKGTPFLFLPLNEMATLDNWRIGCIFPRTGKGKARKCRYNERFHLVFLGLSVADQRHETTGAASRSIIIVLLISVKGFAQKPWRFSWAEMVGQPMSSVRNYAWQNAC
jgi:hypothetical protein